MTGSNEPWKRSGGAARGRVVLIACILGAVTFGFAACSKTVTALSHGENAGALASAPPKIMIVPGNKEFVPGHKLVDPGEQIEFVSECHNQITVKVRDGGMLFIDGGSEFPISARGTSLQSITPDASPGSYELCVLRCEPAGGDGGSERNCSSSSQNTDPEGGVILIGLTGTLEVSPGGQDVGERKK